MDPMFRGWKSGMLIIRAVSYYIAKLYHEAHLRGCQCDPKCTRECIRKLVQEKLANSCKMCQMEFKSDSALLWNRHLDERLLCGQDNIQGKKSTEY